MATKNKIEYGRIGVGIVNGYPPARWRYVGVVNGSCLLQHIKRPNAAASFPSQGVDRETLERIMRD